MTEEQDERAYYAATGYRLFSGVFGALLVIAAGYALLFAETSLVMRLAGAALLALPGGNMITSAIYARESWLSRIGPLP